MSLVARRLTPSRAPKSLSRRLSQIGMSTSALNTPRQRSSTARRAVTALYRLVQQNKAAVFPSALFHDYVPLLEELIETGKLTPVLRSHYEVELLQKQQESTKRTPIWEGGAMVGSAAGPRTTVAAPVCDDDLNALVHRERIRKLWRKSFEEVTSALRLGRIRSSAPGAVEDDHPHSDHVLAIEAASTPPAREVKATVSFARRAERLTHGCTKLHIAEVEIGGV